MIYLIIVNIISSLEEAQWFLWAVELALSFTINLFFFAGTDHFFWHNTYWSYCEPVFLGYILHRRLPAFHYERIPGPDLRYTGNHNHHMLRVAVVCSSTFTTCCALLQNPGLYKINLHRLYIGIKNVHVQFFSWREQICVIKLWGLINLKCY